MGGPFDKPPMTQVEFVAELKSRGFHFNESQKVWVGPFGIMVTGVPGQANFHTESGMFNPQGIGNAGLTGGGIGPGVSGPESLSWLTLMNSCERSAVCLVPTSAPHTTHLIRTLRFTRCTSFEPDDLVHKS